jgi:hypothetical protein
MGDSYEQPADHRPWQARRPDWAGPGQRQDPPDQPAVPMAGAQGPPAGWAGRGPNQDPTWLPKISSAAGFGLADWPAQNGNPNHANGHATSGGSVERRPAGWLASDPYQRHPALPDQPAYRVPGQPAYRVPGQPAYPVPGQPAYPARTAPFWRQGWADYDPYSSYPTWPGHPGYATRNAGLRRLSKLTWRAAEVSAVIAVGFAALFARTAHSATSHAGAQQSAKPSIHAAATHPAHKQHKPKHHRHHHHHPAIAPASGLAPPAAPPAAPPPPPPPPAAPAARTWSLMASRWHPTRSVRPRPTCASTGGRVI